MKVSDWRQIALFVGEPTPQHLLVEDESIYIATASFLQRDFFDRQPRRRQIATPGETRWVGFQSHNRKVRRHDEEPEDRFIVRSELEDPPSETGRSSRSTPSTDSNAAAHRQPGTEAPHSLCPAVGWRLNLTLSFLTRVLAVCVPSAKAPLTGNTDKNESQIRTVPCMSGETERSVRMRGVRC